MSQQKPKVDWIGPVESRSGYGRHARELALELYKRNVDISVTQKPPRDDILDLSHEDRRRLSEMKEKGRRNHYSHGTSNREAIEVWVLNPAHALCNMSHSIYDPEVYTINLTVYEAETIPQTWVSIANEFDEIWVPAEFSKDAFEKTGVENNFHVMPEGANIERFKPDGEKLRHFDEFTFISVFDFTYRKGWDVLLEAYCQEFTEFENVNLLIKSHYRSNTNRDHEIVTDSLKKVSDKYNSANYELIFGYLEEEQMPKLYRSGDAFVLPTRGEGFGLPLFEAAATNLSVITTDYGAPPEYLDNDVYWIDTKGTSPYPFEEASKHEPNCSNIDFGEPSITSTRQKLREVYTDQIKGNKKSPDISNITWEESADKVEDRIHAIWNQHY